MIELLDGGTAFDADVTDRTGNQTSMQMSAWGGVRLKVTFGMLQRNNLGYKKDCALRLVARKEMTAYLGTEWRVVFRKTRSCDDRRQGQRQAEDQR
jgi:hypothetical protein